MKIVTNIIFAICALAIIAVPVSGRIGVGFHYGVDLTLGMDDALDEQMNFGEFNVGSMFGGLDTLSNSNSMKPLIDTLSGLGFNADSLFTEIAGNASISTALPMYMSRSDFKRSKINLGGKVWLDFKRIISALELSFNIGVWEYKSTLKYPTGVKELTQEDVVAFMESGDYTNLFIMGELPISLSAVGLSYLDLFGIGETPYMKLHFDAAIKKNLLDRRLAKIYLGAGPSLHFGTPILTNEFISGILEETLDMTEDQNLLSIVDNLNTIDLEDKDGLPYKILNRLIEEGKTPKFGLNIVGGISLKLPVIPLGIYCDGKFMIPFGSLDNDVDLNGMGALINIGIMLNI